MNPSTREIELSHVACLLDELNGKNEIDPDHWDGRHPEIYNRYIDKKSADALVASLCEKLRNTDIIKCSLEMQMWWRDHQKADRKRIEREEDEQRRLRIRERAIQKLTTEERKVLEVR